MKWAVEMFVWDEKYCEVQPFNTKEDAEEFCVTKAKHAQQLDMLLGMSMMDNIGFVIKAIVEGTTPAIRDAAQWN